MTRAPDDYSDITDDEFDRALLDLLAESSPSTIIATPGVYEVLREEWNNEILDRARANKED